VHQATPDLTTVFGGAAMMVFLVVMGAACFAFPFMVFSVVRNISRTRKALERIATALEGSPRAGNGNILGI